MAKLKDSYRIGYGHPQFYQSGLIEGVYFYSDTDKRLSNTRDLVWPEELKTTGRDVPEYELILRRVKRKVKKRK